jgi:hypothetical protein
MLFDYNYLIENFEPYYFNNSKIQSCEFIIPINEKIIGRNPEVFQILLNSKNSFCFYIPSSLAGHTSKFIKDEVIQNLVRLLFLPNCTRINGNYIFYIEKAKDNNDLNLLQNEFYCAFKKQGIADIIFDVLHTEPLYEDEINEKSISLVPYKLNNYLTHVHSEKGFETLVKEFSLSINFHKKWIVPVISAEDFQYKLKLIERFENWIETANPFQAQLIKMYSETKKDGYTVNSENKILRFKLENSASYLKLIREESNGFVTEISSLRKEVNRLANQINNPAKNFLTEDPHVLENEEFVKQLRTQIMAERHRADEIFEWYKNEYEVLPIWYKQFGQIIKVFKGKRTFKSLFK